MLFIPAIKFILNYRVCCPFTWLCLDPGRRFRKPARHSTEGGFTVLELVVVLGVIGIIGAISVPTYFQYVENARDTKAIHDIHVMERLISTHEHSNDALPESLDEIGEVARLDPWGNPYEYVLIAETRKGRKELIKLGVLEDKELTKAEKKALDKRKPRKDRFMVLVNTDYDLYSKGPDGLSKANLNRKVSRDDIVRAVDGDFIGRESNF